jgi:hypothetical protein
VNFRSKKSRLCRVALSWLLSVSFAIHFLYPEFAMIGVVDQSRIVALDRLKARADERFDGKDNTSEDLALHRGAGVLSFGLSLSALRFDFKQNPRTWPVLGTGIERSPPSV